METKIPNRPKEDGSPLPVLLGAACTGAAAVFIPLGLLIAPALFAYAMCRAKPAYLALFGGVYAVLSFLFLPAFTALCLSALCLGMAAALYWMQTRKMSNTYTALALSGIALAALYAAACLPGILSGEGAFAPIQAMVDAAIDTTRQVTASAVSGLPETLSAGVQEYFALLDSFSQMVPSLIVPCLCMAAGLLSLVNLLFFHLFAGKGGLNVSRLRPFRLWAIPQRIMYGMIFLLIVSLIFAWSGWDYANALSSTVNVLVGMPLMLQGLCVVDFLIVRSGNNITTKRVLIYLAAALLFVYAQALLMMLGCFDQLFRFRMRASIPPPGMPRDGF